MDPIKTSSQVKSGDESHCEDKQQHNKNQPGRTSNDRDSVSARTNTSQLIQHKPYGILRLPTNVFVQITTYLKAEDLLFLARTTKQFRRILMARSSAYAWRAAIANTTGLPPCPTTIAEPLYTAVVFTEDYSICWKHTESALETDLLVRLCEQCHESNIIVLYGIYPAEIRDLLALNDRALLSEVNAAASRFAELKAAPGGQAELEAWKQEKRKELTDRQNRGDCLTLFLNQKALDEKKSKEFGREADIIRRLIAEGWSTEHIPTPKQPWQHSEWTRIVSRPGTLSDHERSGPSQYLTGILKETFHEHRKEPRWARLEKLWNTIKDDLGQSAGVEDTPKTLATAALEFSGIMPTPEFSDTLQWPVIKDLLNTDRSVSEMEGCFVQQRPAIDREVSAWCTRIKIALADLVRESLIEHKCTVDTPVTGTIAGDLSNSPLRYLSPEMQLLARADTIFMPYEPRDHFHGVPSMRLCDYETYMHSLRRWIGYERDDKWKPISDTRFRVHLTAPAMARTLLGVLGKPLHTTILEMEDLGECFVCGRYNDEEPKSWLEIIKYYLDRQEEWDHIVNHMKWFAQNNIATHNVHDLNADNPKPLVQLVLPKEQSDSASDAESEESEKPDYVLLCGHCLRASYNAKPMTKLQMRNHLYQMHEISVPQLEDPEADLWKPKNRNYRIISAVGLESDGEFSHDDYSDGSWWAGSEDEDEDDEEDD